ncbi:MAG: hypothetical protein DRJ01_18550 [Bacteroidetes bacterium]|nr:MAG: hypothetical protein DRJ01_18550 [Bacteroidota bacterium]
MFNMRVFDANITNSVIVFFENSKDLSIEDLNSKINAICGINTFFEMQSELDELINTISNNKNIINEPDRAEYGDFQTNRNLSDNVCNLLKNQNTEPEIIIEPTCGKGNFIISSLKTFKKIKFIYGVEIYKPYVWETKFNILDYFLDNKISNLPEINIYHYNVFDFNFDKIASKHKDQKILIIGNPPWVTNSKLSSLGSDNLPLKSNFKNHNGLDAITGKGNFDIGEYISVNLISIFSKSNGNFAFLVKNSVVKNILLEQNRTKYQISNIEQFDIDAKKEFNVSVNACLLSCSLNKKSSLIICEYDFYTKNMIKEYGWVNDKFVANIELYLKSKDIDGKSPFVWRQGVKHDASKIMEFENVNGSYLNNNEETVEIEKDLVFALLKSSDLKGTVIDKSRKYTIITQRKVGQETKYIKELYPKTYNYLFNNIEYFKKRKSSIYKGKPVFSIFGIGDYSFKPYKVAIAGMYKTTTFSLVKPNNSKPVMLDDTCYFIGFDTLIEAEITRVLLNKEITQNFIQSIAFKDAKRMITKDLLMRIDLAEIIKEIDFYELQLEIPYLNIIDWENYKGKLTKQEFEKNQQLDLFDKQALHTTTNIVHLADSANYKVISTKLN